MHPRILNWNIAIVAVLTDFANMAVVLSDLLRNLTFNRSAHCTQVSDQCPLGLLFFKLLPNKTLKMKGEKCFGGKKSKERILVLLCSNMDGTDMVKPLVIGKFQNPRCFKGVKSLPVDYRWNRKAWMTSEIFIVWLRKFDSKMVLQKRKVLLFVDNCSAHPRLDNLKAVKLAFLPPNCTSTLPMDQGVIYNFKVK